MSVTLAKRLSKTESFFPSKIGTHNHCSSLETVSYTVHMLLSFTILSTTNFSEDRMLLISEVPQSKHSEVQIFSVN